MYIIAVACAIPVSESIYTPGSPVPGDAAVALRKVDVLRIYISPPPVLAGDVAVPSVLTVLRIRFRHPSQEYAAVASASHVFRARTGTVPSCFHFDVLSGVS